MDKYDRAIEYLTRYPEEIYEAWASIGRHEAGCLFQWATQTGKQQQYTDSQNIRYGCLVQICYPCLYIECREYVAETPALTDAIRADERIPRDASRIRVRDLPVFAEWQRRIDRELRRT